MLFDFNRSIELSEEDKREFQTLHNLAKPRKVARAAEELHDRAYNKVLSFGNVKFSCDVSIEFFYLSKWIEQQKLELKNHPRYCGESDTEIEKFAVEDSYILCQEMCRRSLI